VSRYLLYISQNYSFAILRPLQEAILARGGQVAWFVEGSNVNHSYFKLNEKVLLSVDDVFNFKAHATFYPSNIAPTFLPGINVAIFHGFDAGKVDKSGKNDHIKMRNCFDLYCTQGPMYTEGFNQLVKTNKHYKVIETGWPAIDRLYEKTKDIEESTIPTILFCSTFSRNLMSAPHLFEEIKRLSSTGKYRWLVQFHPKMSQGIIEQYKSIESEYLSFIETDNIIPLLQEADLMVCDTSSVLLMFLLLNKPVVTFNNISPKDYLINITEPELLESSIDEGLTQPKTLMNNINTFIEQTHPYQDGCSSERVLDAVDEVILQPNKLAKKPFDLFRQFKMRKKLGYWKFW
jgi:CDP-glycerol glycerophosphotransferase (TagB/SpsB family)